ncbi:cell division protein ZapA, partial [bacterium]|nr:cell division protein ZapA [bacterium]
MAQVIITINYREYPISCQDGEEIQIMKLGRLLDEKARSLTEALGSINENLLLAMTGLLVA